ncbi:hypothetical protein KY360_05250 [Candidatus Woesearchaeota archaeon]|nr:hypothetical protein [Candidatus Woesearchaeota archaeon]
MVADLKKIDTLDELKELELDTELLVIRKGLQPSPGCSTFGYLQAVSSDTSLTLKRSVHLPFAIRVAEDADSSGLVDFLRSVSDPKYFQEGAVDYKMNASMPSEAVEIYQVEQF